MFNDYLLLTLTVRENYIRDVNPVTEPFWSTLLKYAIEKASSPAKPAVIAVLSHPQIRLTYRILKTLCPWKKPNTAYDNRPWQMFTMFANCAYAADLTSLGAADFSDSLAVPSANPDRAGTVSMFVKGVNLAKRDNMRIKFLMEADSFSKILFFMFLAKYNFVRHQEKNVNDKESLPTRNSHDASEIVGKCVTIVVNAWTTAAGIFSFSSLETMIAPYIIFNETELQFDVIEDKFAPPEQLSSLLHGSGIVDSDAAHLHHRARASPSVNRQLRNVATIFITYFFSHHVKHVASSLRRKNIAASFSRSLSIPTTPHSSYGHVPTALHYIVDKVPGLQKRVFETPPSPSPNISGDDEPAPLFPPSTSASAHDENHDHAEDRVFADNIPLSPAPAVSPDTEDDNILPLRPRKRTRLTEDTASMSAEATRQATSSRAARTPPSPRDFVPTRLPSSLPSTPLRKEFYKAAFVFNCSFHDLPQIYQRQFNKSLHGQVQLVCIDPPFHSRSDMQRPNSAHDILSEDDMRDCLSVTTKVLRKGGHLLLFSGKSQTQTWISFLQGIREMSVDRVPLYIINARNNLSQPPFRRGNKYINMVTEVVHAVKLGGGAESYTRVQYSNHGYVPSSFAPNFNVIDNVQKMVPGEKLMKDAKCSLRPEQKPVALLKELIERHSLPGSIVLDMFGGTYSTGVACLQLPAPRVFVGCEMDKQCHDISAEHLFHRFAEAIVSDRFPLLAEKQLFLEEARSEVHNIVKRRSKTSPLVRPSDWPIFCALPDHLVYFFCTATRTMNEVDTVKRVELAKWPSNLLSLFRAFDVNTLLAADASFHGVYVAKSRIPGADNGVFALQRIAPFTVIGWYSGTIVHKNITKSKHIARLDGSMYGRDELGCTVDRFKTYSMRLPNMNPENTSPRLQGKEVFVVPPPYCVAAYINDKKNIQNGLEADNAIIRHANAQFEHRSLPFDFPTFTNPYFVFVTAITSIEKGEEVLVNYGKQYWP